jgi:hypothetical protein
MPTCQPGKVDAKADVAPSGATKRKVVGPPFLEGFVFSGSIFIAVQIECESILGYDQSYVSRRYFIARTRTVNAGCQSREADGSPLLRWH